MSKIKGFSLVEILIAVGILTLIVLGVATFFSSQQKTSKLIEGSAVCRSEAQTVMETISVLGTRASVADVWIPTSSGPNRFPSYAEIKNDGDSRYLKDYIAGFTPNWFALPLIGTGPTPRLNNAQMIIGSTGLLQALLNSNLSYCSNDDSSFGEPITAGSKLIPQSTQLIQPEYFLKIQVVDSDGGTLFDCPSGPVGAMPVGASRQTIDNLDPADPSYDGFDMFHDSSDESKWSNIGFKAILSVRHLESEQTKVCQLSQSFFHQQDKENSLKTAPTTDILFNLSTGAGLPTGGVPYSCGGNDIGARIDFSSIEPGSVILCRGAEATASQNIATVAKTPWYACDQFRFASQTGATTTSWILPKLTIGFNDLGPDKKFLLEFKTVDTAGNSSPVGSAVFIVDSTAPGIGTISEDTSSGDIIGPPESDPTKGRLQLPSPYSNTVNWSVTDSRGRKYVQCQSTPVSFSASYDGGIGDFPETRQTCTCTYDGLSRPCVGSCSMTTPNVTHGSHTVTMTPRDLCRTGTTIASYTWTAVLDTAFSPAASMANPPPFDRESGTPAVPNNFEPVTVPVPFTAAPTNHYVVQCDCNSVGGAALVEGDRTCGAMNEVAAACRAPAADNFSYRYWDVCGRDSYRRLGNQFSKTTYTVQGDEGDRCTSIACGVTGNSIGRDYLVCCNGTGSGGVCETPGVCESVSGLVSGGIPPQCTSNIVGHPPAGAGCPSDGAFDCEYSGNCKHSSASCPDGSTNGSSPCGFTASGTCTAANVCTWSGTCPSDVTICSGPPTAPFAAFCTGANNGASCSFASNSVCENVNGSCQFRLSPTGGAPENVVCPDRGPASANMCGATPPVPSPDPCAPNYSTYEDCLANRSNPATQRCELAGSCYNIQGCPAGAYPSAADCMANNPDSSHNACVTGGAFGACYGVHACGAGWTTKFDCENPVNPNSCTTCNPAPDNVCWQCSQNLRWVFNSCERFNSECGDRLTNRPYCGTLPSPLGPVDHGAPCATAGAAHSCSEILTNVGLCLAYNYTCTDISRAPYNNALPPPPPALPAFPSTSSPPGLTCTDAGTCPPGSSWVAQRSTCLSPCPDDPALPACREIGHVCKSGGATVSPTCCTSPRPTATFESCSGGTPPSWHDVCTQQCPSSQECQTWNAVCKNASGATVPDAQCPQPKVVRAGADCNCLNGSIQVDGCTLICVFNIVDSCRQWKMNPAAAISPRRCCSGAAPTWSEGASWICSDGPLPGGGTSRNLDYKKSYFADLLKIIDIDVFSKSYALCDRPTHPDVCYNMFINCE